MIGRCEQRVRGRLAAPHALICLIACCALLGGATAAESAAATAAGVDRAAASATGSDREAGSDHGAAAETDQPGTAAETRLPGANEPRLPAVGEALAERIPVLWAPRAGARRIATLKALRFDYRPTVLYISERATDQGGNEWLRVDVPGRPNGRRGWVLGSQVRITRVAGPFELVISLRQRRLSLLRGGRRVFSAPVAIGTPAAPTPRGRFYVTAAFAPADPFLGVWAFEISAYAAITEWPRGGIVGLHGTNAPELIGQRVSHGCIRMTNRAIRFLKKRVRPGVAVTIRP